MPWNPKRSCRPPRTRQSPESPTCPGSLPCTPGMPVRRKSLPTRSYAYRSDNVLGVKVQPQHQIVALRACCARCIGYRCNLCLGQLALVHACLRYLTGQHDAVNTAAAVGQQSAGVREADIGGCARPALDLGIECRCINVAAVVLVLVGIAAGRAVETADILHPLALLDASVRVCVVIVPEEFAVVMVPLPLSSVPMVGAPCR